jgi:carboxylesterase type B
MSHPTSGAASVSTHLVAPRSQHLFRHAAMWSGALPDWAVATMPSQQHFFNTLARVVCPARVDVVACLADVDAASLVEYASSDLLSSSLISSNLL